MNFIIGSQDVKGGMFPEKQPYSSSTVAFVYINPQEEMVTIKDGQRLSRAELRYGKFNKMYRIDSTAKTLDYSGEFPSQESVETFKVQVSLVFSVTDPALILRNRNENYTKTIHNHLFYPISDIAKQHLVSEYNRVKYEIECLASDLKLIQKIDNLGLQLVDVSANVELSAKSKEHYERLNNLDKDAQYQQKKAESRNYLNTQEIRAKNNMRSEEMEGIAQLTDMYGLDGLRVALASNDQERAAIIKEIQEKQQKQQKEQQQLMEKLLEKGMSLQDISQVNSQLRIGPNSQTFNPSAATAQPGYNKIEEPKPQNQDDDLFTEFSKIVTIDSEKGE